MTKSKLLTKPFLLEIGTEELPSDAIRVLKNELKGRIDHWLNERNLLLEAPLRNLLEAEDSIQDIAIEVTPRRIVIYMEGIPVLQPDTEEEIMGPPVKAGLTENNEPTKALLGFLKSKGATLDDIFKKPTERGDYVALRLKKKGVKTEKLLKNFVEEIFSSFPFPKVMRWDSNLRFPRPIRWILAVWGKDVLPVQYAGLKAGRLTYGHRFLADRSVSIKKADLSELEKVLKKLHVTLSFEKRAAIIRSRLLKTNPASKIDEELIQISAALTEDPVFIQGGFDKQYLKLPEEILATSMRKHQKIFVLYDNKGKVLPQFLAVVNGKKKNPSLIRKNYENVLLAKLEDAAFFYNEDTKTKLGDKVEKLKKVTFLGKLGTLFEKTERLCSLGREMASDFGLSGDSLKDLERAAWLSKADLETLMVYEFPNLQGFVGSEYAKRDGETKAVSDALKDYYLPSSLQSEDPLRLKNISKTSAVDRLTGALLGILDKLDTLVGATGTGIEVKGSEDPYALRRAANGIVMTVLELKRKGLAEISFSMEKLIRKCIELYGEKLKLDEQEILARLKKLLEERLLWLLSTERARDKEFLQAVFQTSSDDLIEVWNKFYFLKSIEKDDPEAFYRAYKILERTRNILKGAKGVQVGSEVNAELFRTEEEKNLFEALEQMRNDFSELAEKKFYEESTKLYASKLYDRIHQFFDKVLVNDKDESIRRNRLALMHCIYSLYTEKIADLSVMTQMEPPGQKSAQKSI